MSISRIWTVLRKDLALGPRSPIFMYAIALPVIMTFVFQVAFGSLFAPQPRMGVADAGDSEITTSLADMEGIELTRFENEDELKRRVEANDLDGGLVLPAGFDEAVRSGEKPPLELYIGGESLASNRIIVSVTTLDLVREVQGTAPPVDVEVVDLGEPGLPISLRLVPVIMMYALFIAGTFVPASSIVEEKEKGTISAMLVTPATVAEVLAAKAILGAMLAFVMSIVTLLLNGAFAEDVVAVVVVVLVASVFSAMLGLVIGALSKDSTAMFTLVKGSGIFLFAPVAFYLFPDWPQWIARFFPTYWAIDPIWQVAVLGNGLGDVWLQILVAIAIIVVLVPVIALLSKRMVRQLAAG